MSPSNFVLQTSQLVQVLLHLPHDIPPKEERPACFEGFMVNDNSRQYIHSNIQFKRRCRYEYVLLYKEPSTFNNNRSRVIPWSPRKLSDLRQVPEVPGLSRAAPPIRQAAGGEKRSEMDPLP